ncbi:MAG: hypothetical protein ACI9XK_004782 [Granulosicoccus sp.]|jgi:hypothetical protein
MKTSRFSDSQILAILKQAEAGQSVRYSFLAKAYYEQQKQKGKPHNTIIRSLAFKWIRIVFRCWKDRTPYDAVKYLQALRSRRAPLLEFAAQG